MAVSRILAAGVIATHLISVVSYVDRSKAFSDGLAFWTEDGVPGIQTEHWSTTDVGAHRNSVRITTKSLFEGELFIIDMALMPWGCGVWPAFWTLGADGAWPETGEIDIIEGVQANTNNHSMPGCAINSSTEDLYTGYMGNQDCDSSNAAVPSFPIGMPFNEAGGGVFAMLWDNDGIRMWNWARAQIPSDINNNTPSPSTWDLPVATWDASICDLSSFFKAQILTLNIDICGDWIDNTWDQFFYCPGTCPEYVSNPSNLNNTVMLLNYVKVYQQAGAVVTTRQAESNSNLTGAGGPVGRTSGANSNVGWMGVGAGWLGAMLGLGFMVARLSI
ncbi:hypothetical protein I350_06047 [Cryptococcus amylolentus CBS 6273]|uniref:GH16 domain-containing protein n=1 Tax=Cryptococcus amylolentus CBS 6273 TaxID=1296118 RepID=A0A1E3JTE2_9TREE|nr:hypothetical protein I350_06047 [Cryptococcus amylolentus CBS 6273]